MNTQETTRRLRPLFLAVAMLLPVLAGSVALAESKHCVTASIPAPFVLPDGSTHPAGALKVCYHRNHSPVAGMHATYVGGQPIGNFMSRRGATEGRDPSGAPYMLFTRRGSGALVLQAYAVPNGDSYVTYELFSYGPKDSRKAAKAAASDPVELAATEQTEPIVYVAAVVR